MCAGDGFELKTSDCLKNLLINLEDTQLKR